MVTSWPSTKRSIWLTEDLPVRPTTTSFSTYEHMSTQCLMLSLVDKPALIKYCEHEGQLANGVDTSNRWVYIRNFIAGLRKLCEIPFTCNFICINLYAMVYSCTVSIRWQGPVVWEKIQDLVGQRLGRGISRGEIRRDSPRNRSKFKIFSVRGISQDLTNPRIEASGNC